MSFKLNFRKYSRDRLLRHGFTCIPVMLDQSVVGSAVSNQTKIARFKTVWQNAVHSSRFWLTVIAICGVGSAAGMYLLQSHINPKRETAVIAKLQTINSDALGLPSNKITASALSLSNSARANGISSKTDQIIQPLLQTSSVEAKQTPRDDGLTAVSVNTSSTSISMTMSSTSIDLNIMAPTYNGAESSTSLTTKVTTDNPAGYILELSTTTPDLINESDSSNVLAGVTSVDPLRPLTFNKNGCNAWGYAVARTQVDQFGLAPSNFAEVYSNEDSVLPSASSETWNGVSTSPTILKSLNQATNDDTTQITFGACADSSVAAGNYTGTVQLTAIPADPIGGDDNLGGEPVMDIDANMIPVKYTGDAANPEWQKADVNNTNHDWYNYDQKLWANAVTFTDTNKLNQYKAAAVGTVIPESDIGAYWVYIPRYRYQLMCMDYDDCQNRAATPTPFSIQFENMDNPNYQKSGANDLKNPESGDWMTHPAFTIGSSTPDDPTDDAELNGLWVGKFETSNAPGDDNLTNATYATPTIKPNQYSLRYQNILNEWNTSQTVRTHQNLSNQTQTFMANNDDWGAVTYLASSIYGAGVTNDDYGAVHINSNSSYVTGCGPTSATSDSSYAGATTCTPTGDNVNRSYYTTLGRLASTTNNPTGVYDMSGGAWEYTLGNYDGTVKSSGLTSNGKGGFTQIPSKYINFYSSTIFDGTYANNIQKCTLFTCGGQAMYETASWNGDYANFVYSYFNWSVRGGDSTGGSGVGLFSSRYYAGGIGSNDGFRVLAGRR
jgi:hypothetical protein